MSWYSQPGSYEPFLTILMSLMGHSFKSAAHVLFSALASGLQTAKPLGHLPLRSIGRYTFTKLSPLRFPQIKKPPRSDIS